MTTLSKSAMLGFALLLVCSLSAAAHVSLPASKFSLDNGLEVIFQRDLSTPFVTVSVWYHVGAKEESPGKTGFAHLFEHLMFQGTPHVGYDKHFAYLQQAGATVVNGTTDFDRTNYFETVPSNALPLALWLESDRMAFLMDSTTQAKLDEQRNVVKNERLQTLENQPYGLATEKAWKQLFAKNHPYFGYLIGSMADLDRASLQDVRDFYNKFYVPANATLAIVGNFDPQSARELVQRYFGTLAKHPKPAKPVISAPLLTQAVTLNEVEKLGNLTLLEIQYLTPKAFAPGDADLDVLSDILSNGKSSLLVKRLVHDKQWCQSISASQHSLENVSVFSIRALLQPGADPKAVLAVVDDVLHNLVKTPPTAHRIAGAVRFLDTQKLLGLEQISGLGGRTEMFQYYNHYFGTPDGLERDFDRYKRVSPESLTAVMQTYLKPTQRVVLIATRKS